MLELVIFARFEIPDKRRMMFAGRTNQPIGTMYVPIGSYKNKAESCLIEHYKLFIIKYIRKYY